MLFNKIWSRGKAAIFLFLLFMGGEIRAQTEYPGWYLNPPQVERENANIHFYGVSSGFSYEKALANSIAEVAYQMNSEIEKLEKMISEMTGVPYQKRSEAISLTLDSLEVQVSQNLHEVETYRSGESNYR